MKKYVYIITGLSFLGVLLSGILLIQHYFPETDLGFLSCTPGADNPCAAISTPDHSTLLGLPIASYGILSYLFYIFVVLIADYAGGKYFGRAIAIIFPLSILSLMVDLILILILIIINKFCFLCFLTYIINSLLMIASIIWYREYVLINGIKPSSIYIDFAQSEDSHDWRAAFSLFVLFIFFLSFAVFSTTHILKSRAGTSYLKKSARESFVNEYVSTANEKIHFPPTPLTLGKKDARLNIRVFTDFLCSACYGFFKTEKYLLSRFKGKIKISYYNYPLDRSCNDSIGNTVYRNSCIAAFSMIAAAKQGIYEPYHNLHYDNYRKYHAGYSIENALENLDILSSRKKLKNIKVREFHLTMKSPATADSIKQQVKLANRLKIEATPTLFINGRRIVGIPPRELLEAAILYELGRKN